MTTKPESSLEGLLIQSQLPFGMPNVDSTTRNAACTSLNCLSAQLPFGIRTEVRPLPRASARRVSIAFRLSYLSESYLFDVSKEGKRYKSQLPFGSVTFRNSTSSMRYTVYAKQLPLKRGVNTHPKSTFLQGNRYVTSFLLECKG